MAAEKSLTYSRVLVTAYETICRNLDLKTVGTKLIEGKKLTKELTKRIKYAVKKDDKATFHALLITMDMKSFVIFLEVLDGMQDKKHKEILRILSQQLRQLSLQGVSEEVVDRLQSITAKYLPGAKEISPTAITEQTETQSSLEDVSEEVLTRLQSSTRKEEISPTATIEHSKSETEQSSLEEAAACAPVLYWQHPVETASFSRTQHNTFYSSVHDITVEMEKGALPTNLDTLKLSLAVNDYSQPIHFPDGYHGMYSVLLSLKCDPHVEAFRLPVTVTVPHSAVGSLEKLRVLTSAEGEDILHEDHTIQINLESIDERYLTFQTSHFTRYMLASYGLPVKEMKAKQRPNFKKPPAKTLSLDETRPVLPPLPRSHSCPASDVSRTDNRFVAVLFTPHDTSGSHWRFTVIVIDHLPTYYDELSEHASQILHVEPSANLPCEKSFFTFTSDYIELCPSEHSNNGWTIRCTVAPPVFVRKDVEQYWHSPPTQRAIISLPYIIYDVYKSPGVSSHTSFSIELKGSNCKSLLENTHPVVFQVSCICESDSKQPPQSEPFTSNQQFSIKIIRDMYDPDPKYCQVVKFLSGGNCSQGYLEISDKNCCTLLCEISFHLFKWEEVGCRLGLESDVCEIKHQHAREHFYVSAFELLSRWLCGADPTLQMLVDVLHSCGFALRLSDWATSYYNIVPRDLNSETKLKLAKRIRCHWKFAARFLGMPEDDIDDISTRSSDTYEQAYQMLLEWQRHCPLRDETAYLQLFKSIHCLKEHIRKNQLKEAARSLE